MDDAASQTNGAKPLLSTESIVAGYVSGVDILNGVSLIVRKGEIVTLVGPNGAGKSTLIKTVYGLLEPRSGTVSFGGEDISGLKPHEITRKGLSYVPQLDNVFPNLTVEDNLLMGGLVHSNLSARLGALSGREVSGMSPSEGRDRIAHMYELFPRLGERRKQDAGTMSGGERQMVAMAKALMPSPTVLLLDEPSAGLAPAFVDAIFEKIADVNKEGVTILMVEQNARRALAMSDRGYVLDLGKERFEGPGKDLISDPKVAELYLGGSGRIDEDEEAAKVVGDAGL